VTVRRILTRENPRLRMKSAKVKRVDRPMQTLIDDMIETMRAAEGVGLAAPQIGVLLRVIVCEYVDDETEELHQTVLINPEVLAKEGEWMAEEGCLSIPGYVGTVPRAVRVTVKGKDRKGKDVRIKTDGQLAHILQHEIDHLDGILFTDYLKSLDELREVESPRKRRRRASASGDSAESALSDETPPAGDEDQPEDTIDPAAAEAAVGSSAPTVGRGADDEPGRARQRYRDFCCGARGRRITCQ